MHNIRTKVANFKSRHAKSQSLLFAFFFVCVSCNVPLLVEIKSQAGKDEGEERHEDGDGDGAAVGGAVGLGVGDGHVLSHAQTWKGAKDSERRQSG